MDYYVAPSYQQKEKIGEPYKIDNKMYVDILTDKGTTKRVRAYDKPQASWTKTKKVSSTEKRVERLNDKFLVFNYPGQEYAYLVGMKEYNGELGFWHYRKKPDTILYSREHNIMLNPLWGYYGTADREPIASLDPEFVREEDVRIEGGYKRLVDDAWWKAENKRLQTMSDGSVAY